MTTRYNAAHEPINWRGCAETLLHAVRRCADAWGGEAYALYLAGGRTDLLDAAEAALKLYRWYYLNERCRYKRENIRGVVLTLQADARAAGAFRQAFAAALDEECRGA